MCSLEDLVEDGAPTGSCDPEYARGFRYGQEYGIQIERERILELLEVYRHNEHPFCYRCDIIELIKGEEK